MKCIYAEQVIGNIFINFINLNKTCELTLSELSILQKKLDSALREKNNTTIYMNYQTIYDVIKKYSEIFNIDEQNEKITLKPRTKNNDIYLERMDNYFRAGLPREIVKTIDGVLNAIE